MKTPKQTKLNTTEPKRELNESVRRLFGCELEVATEKQVYRALCTLVREKLTEQLWETDQYIDDNTLTVNVNRLRKKLAAAGLDGFIATKFGVGYITE